MYVSKKNHFTPCFSFFFLLPRLQPLSSHCTAFKFVGKARANHAEENVVGQAVLNAVGYS